MDNKVKRNISGGKRIIKEILWMYHFYSKYMPRIVGYMTLVLGQTALSFYISYKVGSVVDFALDKDLNRVIHLGITYIVLFSVNALISVLSNRLAAFNYNELQKYVVQKLYKKVLSADWECVSDYHSGDLLIRLSKDTKTVSGNANGFLTTVLSQFVMIVAALSVIIYYDVTMLLVVVIVGPIVLFGSRIFMNKIYESQSTLRQVESRESSFQKESFHNLQAVKAFNLFLLFGEELDEIEKERFETDMRSNKYSLMAWAVSYLSGIISAIICIAWAYYRVYTDVMSLGDLSVIIIFAAQIAYAGKRLIELIPTGIELVSSVERVREILNIPDEYQGEKAVASATVQRASESGVEIRVEDMSFSYLKGTQVFDHVSLYAKPGEIIALVGPSGEGKTTMLRILLGIIHPQEGKTFASIRDKKIAFSMDTRQLISYVPQGNTMMAGTIADNLRLINPNASDEDIIDALKEACAYDFVMKLSDGIYHKIGESGLGFSEGQNQRLAIARALMRKTPILLMDEATSALDVATERKVLANIMKSNPQRTCIVTTHRPSVLSACDRVYKISNKDVRVITDEEIRTLMDEF